MKVTEATKAVSRMAFSASTVWVLYREIRDTFFPKDEA